MLLYTYSKKYNSCRKVYLSLPENKILFILSDIRAFFFAPLRAVLSVETALVLPVFLFLMIGVIQYEGVMEMAVKFGTALSETGKNLAVSAYAAGQETGAGGDFALGILSAAYAQQKVLSKAGDTRTVKNTNMALSSFLQEDEMVDLVLTYQIRSPLSAVKLPGNYFLQRASVRAWTGRTADGTGETGEDGESDTGYVYVTETGSVYHDDPECTHLKLSIREIDGEDLAKLRNADGEKYHACEKCGGGSGSVYITNEGNRYHSSLTCSGLKRTVHQVERGDCTLKACSKCGKP